MNLPYPFDNASGVQINLDGAISLIDDQGKALARLPLATAFELSPEAEGSGHGYGSGYGVGNGDGYGDGSSDGYGSGVSSGVGYGVGYGDGSGRSK
jgi:hypothetical protein